MKKSRNSTFATNKSASFQYELSTRYEAGLVLEGWEVVAIRNAQINLSDSYISMKNGEAWLIGCHITPLKTTTHEKPDPTRHKKLLLNKKELNKLLGATAQKGMSIIPLKLYEHARKIKLAIALAKGKKSHDKRQSIKEKDIYRDQLRTMKDFKR